MSSITATNGGATITLTASASASRSGGTVTVSVPWSVEGYGYYGQATIDGSQVYSKTASYDGFVDFGDSNTKKLTYNSQYAARTFSISYACKIQAQRGGGTSSNSGTLTCSIAAATFTVTFNKNGGNNPSSASQTVTYGGTYGTLPTCTRTGYTFNGWYTATTGGTKITASTTVAITADQTLYAQWTANTFAVTYNKGANGAGTNTSDTKTYGVALTLKGAIFTRTGYTQTGWSTTDGGAKAYNLSASYTSNAAVTLYPFWTANTYTVTFNANGGTTATTSKQITYNGTYGNLPTPTRSGYEFLGWYTTASGGTKVTASTTYNKAGNSTLYAHWKVQAILRFVDGTGKHQSVSIYVVDETGKHQVIGVYFVDGTGKHQGV